jgi:hypothetical protein
MKNLFALLVLLSTSVWAKEPSIPVLSDFTSDKCSMFFNGKWGECCAVHDVKYWMGGSEQERLDADDELNACVTSKRFGATGTFMYYGVRMGGTPMLPTSFRWGYGWKNRKGYEALSPDEKQQVLEKLRVQTILPTSSILEIETHRFFNEEPRDELQPMN